MRLDPIEVAKHAVDGFAVTTTVATIINLLPAIAALLSIVWTMIRIYETKTVQALFGMARNSRPDREERGGE